MHGAPATMGSGESQMYAAIALHAETLYSIDSK